METLSTLLPLGASPAIDSRAAATADGDYVGPLGNHVASDVRLRQEQSGGPPCP